ncbi:MAG: DNA polymerase III subunit delta [Endomicrobium sp.]|jgi:DNA polymerase-3 subunit delta|nr:DNA polymerase III subunit delta [Endomicrobium sp.]
MAKMTLTDFNKSIGAKASKTIYPIYCFAGEEGYFIDSCLNKIQKVLSIDDLNREVFHGKDALIDDIFNALQTIPFFGSKRIVIIKEVNKMSADNAVKLAEYISNPVDSACLILTYLGNFAKDTSDKRKSLINKCAKDENCAFVECKKLYENTARNFISDEFKARGKTADYDAVSMIIEENGVDMLNIVQEIEKASLFVGSSKKSVSEQDIEMISGYTKEANIFHLSNAIEAKDQSKTLSVLDKLLSEGVEPIVILSNISGAVRKLLIAKSMLEEKRMSQSEIASALRIPPFFASAYFSNLKKHNLKRLKASIPILLETDISLKSGSSDKISAIQKAALFITALSK